MLEDRSDSDCFRRMKLPIGPKKIEEFRSFGIEEVKYVRGGDTFEYPDRKDRREREMIRYEKGGKEKVQIHVGSRVCAFVTHSPI